MKHKLLLLTTLTFLACPADKPKPPTPIPPSATPTIGIPPIVATATPSNRCAPQAPIKSCKSANFGDGKGGTLFKRSDTNPKNFAFILSGDIKNYDIVEVCTNKNCEALPFVGCANPSAGMLRGHYKGPLRLNPKAIWKVKFGSCELIIKDKERTD